MCLFLRLHRAKILSIVRYASVFLHMITIETIYYIVVIASIICGAAYKIGYENGKNARK